jgi:FkbM family methyltransferase
MRYDNVSVVPSAVSNTCGTLPLHLPQGAGLTHAASLEARKPSAGFSDTASTNGKNADHSLLEVPVTTLDAVFAEQSRTLNFLKIDVEGHELAVLQGAEQTLKLHRPAILVECEARHRSDGDVRPVFHLLESFGYEGSFFCNGERRPLADFDPQRHQHIPVSAKSIPRDYVNNFAFVAK